MSSGSACWILWLTPMDWLALSIGRSGSQPLEYSVNLMREYQRLVQYKHTHVFFATTPSDEFKKYPSLIRRQYSSDLVINILCDLEKKESLNILQDILTT